MTRSGHARPRLRTLIHAVFAILVVGAIAIYLAGIEWSEFDGLHLSWPALTAASAIALLYRYWGAGIWLLLLERLGATRVRSQWRQLVYVYAKAWLGRYVMGAGTWILGKVYFAAQHGIGRAKLAVSGLLEGALQLIATLIVGLGLLVLDPRLDSLGSSASQLSVVALIACLIALVPAVFRWLVATIYRLIRRRPIAPEDLPDGRSILYGGALYVVGTFITGVSYFFVARAVYADLAWSDMIYVVGASSVAAAVSLLAVFAPGGLGVREGVQVLFLAALMPVEIAVIVAVVTRVWSLLVDVLFFGVALATRPRDKIGVSVTIEDD